MLWAGGAATVTSSSSSSPLKETWKNATVSSADRGIVMFDEVGDNKYVEDDDDTIYVECSTTLSYRPPPPPRSNMEECLGPVGNEGSAVHEHVGDHKLGEDGDGGCDSCIICSECSTTCSMSGT